MKNVPFELLNKHGIIYSILASLTTDNLFVSGT